MEKRTEANNNKRNNISTPYRRGDPMWPPKGVRINDLRCFSSQMFAGPGWPHRAAPTIETKTATTSAP